jgi:formylmethanofuran--tetrahydromethanopterin N-formyltransferase
VQLGDTLIEDTFAEAFRMRYVRLVITAHDDHWLDEALRALTGYAASIIACDAEAGIEAMLTPDETPDGRPGAAVMLFGLSAETLAASVGNRVGQCVMTCPTTAVFDGLPDAAERIPLGKHLRYFGDGYQKSKLISGRRYWRIPVMDGEFLVQESVGVEKGVAGGNLILQSDTMPNGLAAARRAGEAIALSPGVITPFPGGVARSGSKVGSRYKKLKASTSHTWCPTLRGRVDTVLGDRANCAYEIVLDGADQQHVAAGMWAGMQAAVGPGVISIGAGNYGGKLGKFHFHLRQLPAVN